MIEKKLPSGAVLKLSLAPFAEAKELYQAVLSEVKNVKTSMDQEIDINMFKDLLCTGFSSKKIEDAMAPCLRRCTIDGLKIDEQTFEPEERRQDYVIVYWEVARANIFPFLKSLYAELLPGFEKISESLA